MHNHRELLSYFNLTRLPFTKEIPVDQLHLLPSVERNLAAAQLLVDTRGIGAITGKPGSGKSCLLRLLEHRLPAGLYRAFYLCHSSVGTVEFYTHLSVLFGLQPNYRRAAMFRDIKEHVLAMANSAHVHPVLLIDEAHLLSTEILCTSSRSSSDDRRHPQDRRHRPRLPRRRQKVRRPRHLLRLLPGRPVGRRRAPQLRT